MTGDPTLSREDLREIIRDELRRALAEILPLTRPEPKAFLSFRAAAKILGISRNTTLLAAARDRRIRTVIVEGRRRIPFTEIERIQLEGLPLDPAPTIRRRPKRRRRGASASAEILALDY